MGGSDIRLIERRRRQSPPSVLHTLQRIKLCMAARVESKNLAAAAAVFRVILCSRTL